MRLFYSIILLTALMYNSFPQETTIDSVSRARSVQVPWAVKIENGKVLHNMLNQDFVDYNVSSMMILSLYYDHYFLTFESFGFKFFPNKTMRFEDLTVDHSAEFYSSNYNMSLGYCLNFNEKWRSDLRFGFNATDFMIDNPEEINQYYYSDYIFGALVGIGIDRYFKLKGNHYLFLSLGMDYYTTDYSTISPDLNKSAINYILSAGYRGWFRRRIK